MRSIEAFQHDANDDRYAERNDGGMGLIWLLVIVFLVLGIAAPSNISAPDRVAETSRA